MELLTIFLILFVFSLVQSVLGVGLLVFGTPTFLLLGYTFPETLSMVLPPSLLMSSLQVFESRSNEQRFRREFNLFCLPFVLGGLVFALEMGNDVDLNLFIGSMLVFSGALKLSAKLENVLMNFIRRFRRGYLVFMGAIHGLTNMGGGLLTLYSSSLHHNRKVETRNAVAYGYLLMGLVQYATLVYYNPSVVEPIIFSYLAIAGLTYVVLGRRVFKMTQEKTFQYFITSVVLFYGVSLLIN